MSTKEGRSPTSRRQIPPYSSFVAFATLLRRAGTEGIPPQIDKALLIEWGIAAGNESGLLTTLKALGIVDDDGRPTELYREIRLSPPRRDAALRRAADLAYPGLAAMGESPDEDQLSDYFVEQRGLTGQMVDKAMRFYRQLMGALEHPVASPEADALKRAATPSRPTPARQSASGSISTLAPSPQARNVLSPPVSHGDIRAEPGDVRLTLVVQVELNATEDELTNLLRKFQRAWHRSLAAEEE